MRYISAILLPFLLWVGCDDSSSAADPTPVLDGAPPADAAPDGAVPGRDLGRDQGPSRDQGPARDQGLGRDASPAPDRGPDPDRGRPDGGPRADAHPPADGAPDAPADAEPRPLDAAAPDAAVEVDRSDEAFDPNHLLDVQITMAPEDWDRMRVQGRSFATVFRPGCLDQPFESPFTWFTADATIDGEAFPQVGVRKKGFLGSLSTTRPSVKLDFDRNGGVAEFRSLSRMTFNNNRQDTSQVRQCIAYQAFAAAGVPAPRCSFARVTVNGTSLGVYTHVESMKKPFVRRYFADDTGDFYEGQFSDFRAGWSATFQKETNTADLTQPAVDDLTAILALPDDQLFDAVGARVDLINFYAFWAMEAVTGHWDGYSGNTNNYYLYDDPTTGKLAFMPWGTDGTFSTNPFGAGALASLQAAGVLNRRLYLHPDGGRVYLNALRNALAVFDEAALLAEIDRMAALVEPALHAEQRGGFQQALGTLRQFIQAQRGRIEREIAGGPPRLGGSLRAPFCQNSIGDFDFTFDTTWGTYPGQNAFAGSGQFVGTLNGQPIVAQRVGSTAGTEAAGQDTGQVILLGTLQRAQDTVQVRIRIQPVLYAAGAQPIDDAGLSVTLVRAGGGFGATLGLAYAGTLTLEAASHDPGGPVRGRVVGQLMQAR